MYFPAIVKKCCPFDYTDKKGNPKSAFSVTVQLENYETYAVVSRESFAINEPCAFLITSGSYNKPFCSVDKLRPTT